MRDDPLVLGEPFKDLDLVWMALAGLDIAQPRAAAVNHEHRPAVAKSENGARRELQDTG